ncbi:MAG: hypothetical protein Q9160_003023 [Pyrenula sp. 1 TL-2023]
MSLRTGAELITLSLLLNKISGLYGLLAILTGYDLNPLQLSMYIYSLLALALTAFLAPHIRVQSPLQCLALAWFYVLDTVINGVYTATFAVTWFLVISRHQTGSNPSSAGPGADTIDDTAGFTNPQYNVSAVHVEASPQNIAQIPPGQEAVAAGVPASAPAGSSPSPSSSSASLSHGVLQPESFNSIGLICTLWTIRLYFCVIMLAYARFVLRQHLASSASKPATSSQFSYTTASPSSSMTENPFAESKPEGQGWRGRLGRALVRVGERYWLGAEEDDASWMSAVGARFGNRNPHQSHSSNMNNNHKTAGDHTGAGMGAASLSVPGPVERERRRRSGTGPPPPTLLAQAGVSVETASGLAPSPSPAQGQRAGGAGKSMDLSV